jgi:alkylation response protein AidB-like acyl-CoA dehydrogenase
VSDKLSSDETDILTRARALAPEIAAASDEVEARRELPPALVARLIEQGLFRLLRPRAFGGKELRPVVFSQVMEIFAAADASTAWCVGQNNGCAMSAAYLEPEVAREIFGPADGVLAWGPPGAPYPAEPVEGGYRISGKWRFASGSHHATWLGAHAPIAGSREVRTLVFPKASATMVDIWRVVGLRGTGSDEYVVEGLFVPAGRAFLRDDPRDRREEGPLYRFTGNQLYGAGFGGVAMGLAQAALDAFVALPSNKTSRGAGKPARENNVVQSQVAQSLARLRSSRAFLHQVLDEAWARVLAEGEQSEADRNMIRLAATWAIHQSRDVVMTLYPAAGAMAIFEHNPFERRLRDVLTVLQQAQGRQLHFETVGQFLLGAPIENQF